MTPRAFLPLLLAAASLAPSGAAAQTSQPPPARTTAAADPGSAEPGLTLLTQPSGTRLRLRGPAGSVGGPAPLDLPSTFHGRFSVTAQGPTVARTQGVLYVPRRGEAMTLLSEPRGMSAALLVRSLNYPGLPNISAGRRVRGVVLAAAGTGAILASARSHALYRERLGEFGAYSADRARDERLARNAWAKYAGATWAISAVDYWIRPRFDIHESGPGRVTLSVPPLSRGAVMWRSVLIPGAGQEHANHPARGAFWLGAVLATGAGLVIADGMVEHDQTQADRAAALADSAGPSEMLLRLRELEAHRNELQSSEDLRRGFRYALIGAYAANLIDAVLVPVRSPIARDSRVSLAAPIGPHGPGVRVTYRF